MVNNFCYGYFVFYCMTWMPAYLVEQRGLSLKKSGLYTFFSFAGIAIVATVAGWLADRIIERGRDAVFVRKAFVIAGFVGGSTVLLGALRRDAAGGAVLERALAVAAGPGDGQQPGAVQADPDPDARPSAWSPACSRSPPAWPAASRPACRAGCCT
ncbi:MAG: hypothetical protein QM777_01555 [Pseudorhodoferax sp.]